MKKTTRKLQALIIAVAIATATTTSIAYAQAGTVLGYQKIADLNGNFPGQLNDYDYFGRSTTAIGDLDGDGVVDLAVGAPLDDDGGANKGAVWILFLHNDGKVRTHQKISRWHGNFSGSLPLYAHFGFGVTCLGDLDGDGTIELAVGTPQDEDGGANRGAVWILSLDSDGMVSSSPGSEQKISDTDGNFLGQLHDGDIFGCTVASLGDIDGDGVGDLAVGAWLDDDGATDAGAVWILFLNADKTVKAQQKISATTGGLTGPLDAGDQFGCALGSIGDFDGDGVGDLAVGACWDDDGGPDRGAYYFLFLNADGTVKSEQKVSDTQGGFGGTLNDGDIFGAQLGHAGDIDGDGVLDFLVKAPYASGGGIQRGAMWILFLYADGTVKGHEMIDDTTFGGTVNDYDHFGGWAWLGDLDGDGKGDVAGGAVGNDGGGVDRGGVWVLFLNGVIQAEVTSRNACTNPESQTALNRPRVGHPYSIEVDLTGTTGHSLTVLYGYRGGITFTLPGGQCVLVDFTDPSGELTGNPIGASPVARFDLPIPPNVALVGYHVSTQAAHVGTVHPYALSNALDAILGY